MNYFCFSKALARASCIALFAAIAGCASDAALREGERMEAEGRLQPAMATYQESLRKEPRNAAVRAAYQGVRAKLVAEQLQLAVSLQGSDAAQSRAAFERALALDPSNIPAQTALRVIERDARHAAMIAEASNQLAAKENTKARAVLARILRENARHVEARQMMSTIPAASESDTVLNEIYRKPVHLELRDVTLKQMFDALSQAAGLNFVFDKDVKLEAKTSLLLKNSTVESALYYVLLTNQLEQQVMDQNTLLIYPNNAAKQKEYQQTVVRSFQLQNASVKSIAESLKTLLKSKDVVIDEKLNLLILRDSPEAVKLAERLIAAQDMRQPEVMLDVEVLEVSRDRLLELGVQLPSSLTLAPLTTVTDAKITLNDLRRLTGDTVSATIDPLKINARKVDTDTNILANPRIRVVNTEKAKITIGNKVPSITSSTVPSGASSFVAESVTYIDVGVKLEVEPTIYANDEVAIRINLEVSNIVDKQTSARGTTTYTIGNRAAQTMLRLKDGENQVLAGLINDEDRRTANKFPGLGDLPMVGKLFGSSLTNKSKTEIVLSITPRLVRNNEITDEAEVEFASGTDNSLRPVPKRRDSRVLDLSVAPARDRSREGTPERAEGSK